MLKCKHSFRCWCCLHLYIGLYVCFFNHYKNSSNLNFWLLYRIIWTDTDMCVLTIIIEAVSWDGRLNELHLKTERQIMLNDFKINVVSTCVGQISFHRYGSVHLSITEWNMPTHTRLKKNKKKSKTHNDATIYCLETVYVCELYTLAGGGAIKAVD